MELIVDIFLCSSEETNQLLCLIRDIIISAATQTGRNFNSRDMNIHDSRRYINTVIVLSAINGASEGLIKVKASI